MLKVGTILHGTYRIDNYLSSGGFGNTYVATNIEFEERVAIKEFFMKGVTQRDDNQTTVSVSNAENKNSFLEQKEKFKKEARRIRQLKNVHIVAVHDLFDENGTSYYVMDFVDGENLAERLKCTGKPMTEQEVQEILPQILDALKSVHDAGIWHLDLKPANIMVDKAGNVKLIDFGASKQLNAQKGGATTSTAITYTNGYAPREQMEQNYDKFGPWTDIYALGATLYNLLTNKRPPLPTDIDDDMSEDKHIALPMPDVGDNMKRLVLWLMNTNRMQRPQEINDIDLRVLSAIQESKPAPAGQDEETVVVPENGETDGLKGIGTSTPKSNPEPNPKSPQTSKQSSSASPTSKKWIGIGIVALLLVGGLLVWNPFKKPSPDSSVATRDRVLENLMSNMVSVEGGTFTMGATSEQGREANDGEKPAHRVTLSSFSIGKYEVTQEEWQAVMGSNPSFFKGAKRPVDCLSWNDCQKFIHKLNYMTGKQFRLPTEAEWEFATRGGNKSRGYKYAGSDSLGYVAWYGSNSNRQTHNVGCKQPNELGLYDMSGNVWEWCQDKYAPYNGNKKNIPKGASTGFYRVSRGGAFDGHPQDCNVFDRSYHTQEPSHLQGGMRLAYDDDFEFKAEK